MSPSSIEKEVKATHSRNAHLHGMTQVMAMSIAYIATQVCYSVTMLLNNLNVDDWLMCLLAAQSML